MTSKNKPYLGHCGCGYVKYQVNSQPLVVHGCHCRDCQRQTGAAFAINALFVADKIELTQGEVNEIVMQTPSGKGQTISRCPLCQVALWSNYYMRGLRDKIRFLRVGTLEDPSVFPPDVHIFTKSKLPWFEPPENQPMVDKFYAYGDILKPKQLSVLTKMFDKLSAEK